MRILTSPSELDIHNKIIDLKNKAGSHSPSIQTLKTISSDLEIKVDGCFLSNPYATDLFMSHLNNDVIGNKIFREYLEYYPSQNREIAANLSKVINVNENNILIGNGATELIESICNNLIKESCLITLPTFSPYYEFLSSEVERIFYIANEDDNFEINVNDYLTLAKKKRPKSVVIINPNNPTGFYFTKSEINLILDELKFCENIILDESFIHFAYEDNDLDMVDYYGLIEKYPNLIIVKSMSKDFGVAGIRIVYAVMPEKRVNAFLESGYLWNSNGIAEYFIDLYTRDGFRDEYEVERKRYIQDTQIFYKELTNIEGISCYQSKANFFLVNLGSEIKSELLCNIMLIRDGVYTRNCDDKIGLEGNFLRIASRSDHENSLIAESLNGILNN